MFIFIHSENQSVPSSTPVRNINGNYYSMERIEGKYKIKLSRILKKSLFSLNENHS